MARCGCATGAQILLQGSDPVVVTGDGSTGSPFVVALSHDGFQGCGAVAACVGEHLGPGLLYNPATNTIQARISTDASNSITFGSDDGLFSTGGGVAPEACAQKTVDSLVALPPGTLAVGAYRMAGLVQGWPSLEAVDYLLDQNVDLIHLFVAASADGAACGTVAGDAVTIPEIATVHQTTYVRDVTSDQWRDLISMAGDPDGINPKAHWYQNASPTEGYGGGWWGWKTPVFHQVTLNDILRRVGGRAVVIADCQSQGSNSIEVDNIQAALAAIQNNCAQDWCMIGLNDTANGPTVVAAGVTPIALSNGTYDYGSTTLPWDVATLQANTIEWIGVQQHVDDTVFTTYETNNIHTLMMWGDRHVTRTRAETLGVRGYLSHDPVYMRGPVAREYRTTLDPFRNRVMGVGVLSHITSQGRNFSYVVDTAVTPHRVRGYSELSDGGLWIEPGWGGAYGRPSVLQGWACPLPNADTYTIDFEMRFPTQVEFGSTGKGGLLFGAPTDEYTYDYEPGDATNNPWEFPEGVRQYYRVWQRVNGNLGIGVFKPGTGTFYYLNGATESTDITGMEVTSPVPATAVWNSYRLQVTPTSILWRRTLTGGTQYTITADNTDWRGPYWYVEKEESFTGTTDQFDPGREFTLAVRNFIVTSTP